MPSTARPLRYGGDYSGTSVDGVCFDGSYSGGTELTVLTLSDYITAYGNRGMGNMGGRPDKNMGGDFRGGKGGKLPADGEMPEKLPDGELPRKGGVPGGRGDQNSAEKNTDRGKLSTDAGSNL